jgi:geranylgeranyl diphosphate synthase type I
MVTVQQASATGAPALLPLYAGAIDRYLRDTAPPPSSMTGLMAAYHMGWADRDGQARDAGAGKRVRPALCLWACQAAGADPAVALPVAVAVEWVHNFTLVHDDIQDGDRERRHRETVWSIWGTAQGINAGDALHAIAFELLLAPGPAAARRLRAGRLLARAVRDVVEGQCLDLALEGRLQSSPAAYLRMARRKTGALLGFCLEAGALVGGAAAPVPRRLRRAGELLGLAFQVRDDWLGIWGRPALTGKSRDGDLDRRKVTYPVVAGYAAMAPAERRRLRYLFRPAQEDAHDGAADGAAVPELRALLEARAADRRAEEAACRFAAEAVALVGACHLPPQSADQFRELADYVANRTS